LLRAASTPSATMPDLTSAIQRDIITERAKMALDPVMLFKSCVSLFFTALVLGVIPGVPLGTGCYVIAVVLSLVVLDELPKLFHGGLAKRISVLILKRRHIKRVRGLKPTRPSARKKKGAQGLGSGDFAQKVAFFGVRV
jgi:hypothetical protein